MTGPVIYLSGLPESALARRIYHHLRQRPGASFRVVAPSGEWEALREVLHADVQLIEGDPSALDLGLSGEEHTRLAAEIDEIHHISVAPSFGSDRRDVDRLTVATAREVVELAEAADHVGLVVHWSSALVSGERCGYVLEDELRPTEFPSASSAALYEAERLFREVAHLPIVTLRPSIIVGDSETGEVDRFDGPYLFLQLLHGAPPDLRVPMPGKGDMPLNMVPINFVVAAGLHIAAHPEAPGHAFHLVDPQPPTARRVFELLARELNRPVPRGFVPSNLATAVLRAPGIERLAHGPLEFLAHLEFDPIYDDRNARRVLEATGLTCPPFESYVGRLVAYAEQRLAGPENGSDPRPARQEC